MLSAAFVSVVVGVRHHWPPQTRKDRVGFR